MSTVMNPLFALQHNFANKGAANCYRCRQILHQVAVFTYK